MKTVQPDLKEIVKEIRVLGNKIERLEKIVKTKIISESIPDEYEKKAISDYEKKKKTGKLKFTSL